MNFGIYKEKREEKLSKLFKEKGAIWKLDSTDVDGTSNGVNGNGYWSQSKKAPSVKDITGISLPYIGAYKKLDNTKQVVALIDDVSAAAPGPIVCIVDLHTRHTLPMHDFHAIFRFRIYASIAVNAIWHAPIPVIKQSNSMLRPIGHT